jgi:hypothetical protein
MYSSRSGLRNSPQFSGNGYPASGIRRDRVDQLIFNLNDSIDKNNVWYMEKCLSEIVKDLASYTGKCKINEPLTHAGLTALMVAAQYGFKDIVVMLLAYGADVNKANNYGSTALMFAQQNRHNEIVGLLRKVLVVEPVKQGGYALQYASEELKPNGDVRGDFFSPPPGLSKPGSSQDGGYPLAGFDSGWLQVFEPSTRNPASVDLVVNKLYQKKLAMVGRNGLALQNFPNDLKNDRNIVLEAVRQNWQALRWASDELKGDRNIVLEAVRQNWQALEWASDELRRNREVVLAAVKNNLNALRHVSMESSDYCDLVLELAAKSPNLLKSGIKEFCNKLVNDNRDVIDFMLRLVERNGLALMHLPAEFKKDYHVVLAAVSQNGTALCYADWSLKKDKAVVMEALKQNGRALQYASGELKEDRDFILEAVSGNVDVLQYVSDELKDYYEKKLASVWAKYAGDELKGDYDMKLAVLWSIALTCN